MTSAPASAPTTRRPWYVSALVALLAVLLLLGGVWAYVRLQSPFPYYGTVYEPAQQAAAVSGLGFVDGKTAPYSFTPGLTHSAGKTTALFFGFTHCPDVCPATLAYLERVRQAMTPAERGRFQVIFVSLDPARDSPARLSEYARYFGTAQGVQVQEPALGALARSYAVSYARAPLPGGGYQINHTSATFLIDAAGKKRLLWDVTQLSDTARVLRDVRHVMGES